MNVKPENLGSIDLSAYADPVMDELVSGEPELDNSILIDLAREANGTTLEIGCGYGRIAIPLAQRTGTQFVGMDLSAPLMNNFEPKTQRKARMSLSVNCCNRAMIYQCVRLL